MGNRGLLSSLGAGLSLVIAGVIGLAGVSAMVAFKGWPEMRSDRSAEAVRLALVSDAPSGRRAPAVVVGSAGDRRRSGPGPGASPSRTGADRPGGRGSRGSAPGSPETRNPGRTPTRRPDGRGPERPGSSPSPAGGGDERPGSPPPGPSPRPRDPVARAVEGIDRIADEITSPEPDAPTILEGTKQTIDEIIKDTTGIADVVTGTSKTVGGVIEDAGDTVADLLP